MPTPKREPKPLALITDVELRGMIAASDLNATQRGTLAMAADALYRDTLRITASYTRLGQLLGLGRRQTIKRMQSLEATGVLVKVRAGGGRFENGRGRCNVWQLDLDALRCFRRKGEQSDTENGAQSTQQGCMIDAATVHQTAHDPTSPIPLQIKNPNTLHAAGAAGGAKEWDGIEGPATASRRALPKGLRPWVNRFDHPEQSRADRLAQLRAQVATIERSARTQPENPVQFPSEGGD